MHALQKLYFQRLERSTKPFKAKGSKLHRCPLCLIESRYCICSLRPEVLSTQSAFCLLMHDSEILKPSNTAKLIADIVSDCDAYIWSRTSMDEKFFQRLHDEQYTPILIFPKAFAAAEQHCFDNCLPNIELPQKPLFILLDGSWKEAKKILRQSPYLQSLPLLSFNSDALEQDYQLRKVNNRARFSTAAIAAKALALTHDNKAEYSLNLWLALFNYRYQCGISQKNSGQHQTLEQWQLWQTSQQPDEKTSCP